ncbi:hypothetical protein BV25DRAFT_1820730 [Artomyces pyxidatus]|uniref:Uncharacterized protein n=1 Tax=Artomyces pyxidatus TaxID=48021 RepID=A0ACB8TE53_9AGAM|nr:hypothetical protein BV25DRAFT_1820730 [Artomyces pyxidatus]
MSFLNNGFSFGQTDVLHSMDPTSEAYWNADVLSIPQSPSADSELSLELLYPDSLSLPHEPITVEPFQSSLDSTAFDNVRAPSEVGQSDRSPESTVQTPRKSARLAVRSPTHKLVETLPTIAASSPIRKYTKPSLKPRKRKAPIHVEGHVCPVEDCGALFSRKNHLERHIEAIHEQAARIHSCRVKGCGKRFTRAEHLRRHGLSVHSDEKPFVCRFRGCDRAFKRRDHFVDHERRHAS